jgi:DNA modification methylase
MLTPTGYVQEGRWVASQHEDQTNRFHTTQKPYSMFTKIIDVLSDPGDIIYDCFSGSGVTSVTCTDYNRHFYTTELDDTYWEASTKRLETQRKTSKKKNIWV